MATLIENDTQSGLYEGGVESRSSRVNMSDVGKQCYQSSWPV